MKKNIKKYKFRDGYNWKVDPEIAGKTIEKIAAKNNKEVTPQILVKEAAKEKSPLHNCFEWDDQKAGEKFRLHQARKLIASLTVEITINEPETVRAFVNVYTAEESQAYCSIADVTKDNAKLGFVIQDAKKRLNYVSNQLKIYETLRNTAFKIEKITEELNLVES